MSYVHFFFFNDTATTEIYTLSLHDALPIYWHLGFACAGVGMVLGLVQYVLGRRRRAGGARLDVRSPAATRSEEHTSELQSLTNIVCRLLLEKKKIMRQFTAYSTNASVSAHA